MHVHELMQVDVATIGETDDLALALQIMLWREIRHLPVLHGGRVVGMLSEQALLGRMSTGEGSHRLVGTVGDVIDRTIRSVRPSDDVADVAAVLVTSKIDAVPVIEAGKLVGIVTTTDLLSHVAQVPVPAKQTPRDAESVMTSKIVAVHPGERLIDAAAIMVAEGTRHLPVVDGVNRILGILSDRDVRAAVGDPISSLEDGTSASVYRLRVSDAMTANPRTVSPETTLEEVVAILVRERFGALLVADEADKLLGIVSYIDVLDALSELAA